MKKFLIALLLVSVPVSVCAKSSYIERQLKESKYNTEYNTVNIYKKSYEKLDLNKQKIENLKDPKLIKLQEFEKISNADYKIKTNKDNEAYNAVKSKLKTSKDVDYYRVYRIAERLIRANNLDYVNWRIAIRKTADTNAFASNGNFICIYTGLYDSLRTSDDALAFVIGHEMSHLILGHGQRSLEGRATLSKDDNIGALLLLQSYRDMEYMADAEAFSLLYRAGYSPEKAMEALYTINAIPNINSIYSSHPVTKRRIKSAIENIAVLNPNWIDEGRLNIYNSKVLPAKKSSDRVSFVIEKSDKIKNFYSPETFEEKLTRIAYLSYLNGNMENASRLFDKLAKETEKPEHYLYLSYANQYLYEKTKKDKYLKRSKSAIDKAIQVRPYDENMKKQFSELEKL